MMARLLFVVSLFVLLLKSASAQTDSTVVHSPKKATIYSAVLPGLGQAYNKKYWKIPIVYAAIGTSGYFFFFNNKEYQRTREALIARLDENPETTDNDFTDPRYTDELLQDRKSYYRRNRDISAILAVVFYCANFIDADVDAHMMNFNVDENLSLHLQQLQPGISGLSLSYRF